MAIVIEGGRVPKLLSRKNASHIARTAGNHKSSAEPLRIALINNMPDSALEDTEVQFFELLESAAGEIPVSLKLYSLPELPRGEAGEQHLRNFYHGIGELLKSRFDGMIMTGTEPRQPDLRNEPYWPALAEVLEWAERNTASTVLSCLAAHAGVLHSDGIPRLPAQRQAVWRIRIQESWAPCADEQCRRHDANSALALERSASRCADGPWL